MQKIPQKNNRLCIPQHRPRHWVQYSISLLLLQSCLIPSALALDIIPQNSHYYYQLGGGSDLSMPSITTQQHLTVKALAGSNLGFTCDGFNPAISISNTINDIENSIEGIESAVINSATSALTSMPMYLLEKASPEFYNLIQNTMVGAQDTFHISMTSCQQAQRKIDAGTSPYQDWFKISDSQGWLENAKSATHEQDVDVNEVAHNVAQDPTQYGVPWVHANENSGGKNNQIPIQVIYDVVLAGYNVMVDPNRDLDSKVAAPSGSELARYWATPDAAGRWSQLVLGDIKISAQDEQDTIAGIGLVSLLRNCPDQANNALTCANTLADQLKTLVSSPGQPTAQDLQAVSSEELVITPDIIQAIRNENTQNQAIAISKLAEDVALQNIVDEALLLRRLLIAGSQTKPVHNLKPALNTIRDTLADLDKEINNLLFEHQIRQQLIGDSVKRILDIDAMHSQQAAQHQETSQVPNRSEGALYPNT